MSGETTLSTKGRSALAAIQIWSQMSSACRDHTPGQVADRQRPAIKEDRFHVAMVPIFSCDDDARHRAPTSYDAHYPAPHDLGPGRLSKRTMSGKEVMFRQDTLRTHTNCSMANYQTEEEWKCYQKESNGCWLR